ncbi:lysophospholipid acyltransferase family protein [Sulfurimonas sp. SAG-AH-194-I05]|nr:lysophospholipid acyltransferase family protein [Sulfurimonas sp. SAG-AH-194-I05]MDF1874994.1 lysophospholipid acyltransferase family protein [Sulfurimonas sp. SAG-AH-194-I05]
MRKKFFRFLATLLVPSLASLLIRFLSLTNKKVFHGPASLGDKKFIMACWHGELLMIPYAYTRYKKKPHVKLLISEHFDGNLIAKTLEFFGFGTIRGSSTRGGAKALIQSIKEIKKGYDLGITPDGPKGPRHVVHDGIVVMAQKAKVNIVLVRIKPTKYWTINSWDRFVIPKPFGIINYYISEYIDIRDKSLSEAKEIIQEGLLKNE